MWRVLIADDELNIRMGLRTYVDWQKFGMEVVDEAEDGLEALEKAAECRPDVMLVDICMPIMGGLELMARIRELLPDCILIVVSGHDEFEYAQQAIRLQVFDFLLKPVVREQLQATLAKVSGQLAALACRGKYLQWAQQQLDKSLPHLREVFLNDWVSGRLSWAEASEHLDFLKLTVPEKPALMVVKVLDGAPGLTRPADGATALAKGMDATSPESRASESWAGEGRGGESRGNVRERHILLLALEELIRQELSDWQPCLPFRDAEDRLVVLLPIMRPSEWPDLPARIRQGAAQCLNQSLLVEQMVVDNLATDLPRVYETVCDRISERAGLTPVVQLARQYIDEHYGQVDLSLQQVADSLSVSPAYLSRLLKQEVGVSFIKYLTSVRVRQAILLMNDPSLKIYDIASRVGYANQYYFSTAFKKMLEISPLEYRREGHRNP